MELILISESKLKIMLSPPDMAHYELETTHMDCADAHTRAAFRHIFDDARAEVGFDTAGCPLFVQLYASPEGGCEIFVTKLPGEDGVPTVEGASPVSAGERKLLERVFSRRDALTPSYTLETRAFSFTSLEDLLALCRRLSKAGICVRSHSYAEDTPRGALYYLLLEGNGLPPPAIAVSEEYGTALPASNLDTYLTEHGRILRRGDALTFLGKL